MSSKNQLKINVKQLKVGMYVVHMDISWLDSPFLTHSKRIRGAKDILAIQKAGAKFVVIDLDKGVGLDLDQKNAEIATEQVARDSQSSNSTGHEALNPTEDASTSGAQAVAMDKELKAATAVRGKIKDALDKLQKDLDSQKPIDPECIAPLVDETVASLQRNDQALMTLVHLSRKAQKLADHAFGCFCLVLNLAGTRNISESDRQQLGMAALLHEVGWSQLPLNLVGSRTRYSPAQVSLIEKHTLLAKKMLASSELPPLSERLIAEHHELLDGSGYPNKLKADQLHPLSSLLSVVDSYEERVHQLTDKPGMVSTNALRSLYLDAEKGRYDKEIVAAFINMLGIYPVASSVLLNTGEKARVVEVNNQKPLLPRIRIFYDAKGKHLKQPLDLDLAHQELEADRPARSIDSAIDASDPKMDPMQCLAPDQSEFSWVLFVVIIV